MRWRRRRGAHRSERVDVVKGRLRPAALWRNNDVTGGPSPLLPLASAAPSLPLKGRKCAAFPELMRPGPERRSAFNLQTQPPLPAHLAVGMKPKALVSRADAASWERHLAAWPVTQRALLCSEAEQGARAWLAAVPVGRKRMETASFVAELRRGLGVPDAVADSWCPRCDGIMDRHSLHAGTCLAGGERTQRHNALRDLLACWSERAGLQPELEKPGLLLPQRPDETRLAQRRPADIYLPALQGFPAALDLAVTAPQRQETLAQAGQTASAAANQYAELKAAHLNTARVCSAQGLNFVPLVVESTGAWSQSASKILLLISRAVAARTNSDAAQLHAELLQELSVLLRSHHAGPCFAAGLKALSSHMVDLLSAICLAKPVCLSSQLWPLCRPYHFLGLRTMQILIPAIAV